MLRCSAQSDAPQSAVGALGAVAHTFLFLTRLAHRGSTEEILVISYQVQNITILFNVKRSLNPMSAMIQHFSFFLDMPTVASPLLLLHWKIQTCRFFRSENGIYQEYPCSSDVGGSPLGSQTDGLWQGCLKKKALKVNAMQVLFKNVSPMNTVGLLLVLLLPEKLDIPWKSRCSWNELLLGN